MRRDPLAFVVGPIALANDRSRWGVRSGSGSTWYGRYPSCREAATACCALTGERFVRVRDDMHVARWSLWDTRAFELVTEDEAAARRARETKPGMNG